LTPFYERENAAYAELIKPAGIVREVYILGG